MNNNVVKGTLLAVVGVSTVTSGYYGFVRPNIDFSKESAETSSGSLQNAGNSASSNSSSTAMSTEAPTYADGTYTGEKVSTRRGDFQVSVEISNGKISNITMLTQPTESKSQQINATAIPTYIEEAIEAQGSDINMISGASETYTGFTTSLQNALNQAR